MSTLSSEGGPLRPTVNTLGVLEVENEFQTVEKSDMLTGLCACSQGPDCQMKTVFLISAFHVVASAAERCKCASCHAEFVQLFAALWSLLLLKETKTVSYMLIFSQGPKCVLELKSLCFLLLLQEFM